MKSFHVHGLAFALGFVFVATDAQAQQRSFGSPTLLPLPQDRYQQGGYQQVARSKAHLWQQNAPSAAAMDSAQLQDPAPPIPPNEAPIGAGVGTPPADVAPIAGDQIVSGDCGCSDGGCSCSGCAGCCGSGCAGSCGGKRGCGLFSFGRCQTCQPVFGYGFPGPGIINPIIGQYFDRHHMTHGAYTAGCGGSCDCGCNACAACNCCPCPTRCGWFGALNSLIMTRDNANHYHFSVENTPATEHIQLLDVRDAEMQWSGGFEARVGRYFCCGERAWEVVYWGLYPDDEEYALYGANFAGPLDGILDWDQLSIDDPRAGGAPTAAGGGFVDVADAHRVRRDFEFHNVEVNLLNFGGAMSPCSCGKPRFSYNWGVGFRYFRFDEELLFSAKDGGTSIDFDNSVNQLDYLVEVENNLIGGQLTGRSEYCLTNKLSFSVGAKVGLYGNHINHRSLIQSAGNIAYVNNGVFTDADWNINTYKNDVSMTGEATVGLAYQFSRCISATIGYRALGVTGVALTSDQIPSDLRGVNDVSIVDSNGSLLLHGGFSGVEFNY